MSQFAPELTIRYAVRGEELARGSKISDHIIIGTPGKVLDLGAGSGVVGFALHILGKAEGKLYASDLSNDASLLIETNAKDLGIPVISRHGSIFDPWENESFDYIIDDISGIAEKVAEALDSDFDIEIVERHHNNKVDAPSGTALMLGASIAKAKGKSLDPFGIASAISSGDIKKSPAL